MITEFFSKNMLFCRLCCFNWIKEYHS